MMNATIDSLTDKILQALPPSLVALSEDARAIARDLVQDQLRKLDLVSRDEFDIQCATLARTQEKLASLEKLLTELEEKIKTIS
jgi:ubiquinone biosynthesis accessory factor UbiK